MNCRRLLLAVLVVLAAPQARAQQATKPAAPANAQQQPRAAADPAAEAFKAWDKEQNCQLLREGFRAGWERAQQALQTEARRRQHFSTVDANKGGALEPAEYATLELVKKAGKDAPMSRFDANKDGKLQFGEYLRLVQALAPENAGAAK